MGRELLVVRFGAKGALVEAMAASGINAIRTYTVPPRWLLDEALKHVARDGRLYIVDAGTGCVDLGVENNNSPNREQDYCGYYTDGLAERVAGCFVDVIELGGYHFGGQTAGRRLT